MEDINIVKVKRKRKKHKQSDFIDKSTNAVEDELHNTKTKKKKAKASINQPNGLIKQEVLDKDKNGRSKTEMIDAQCTKPNGSEINLSKKKKRKRANLNSNMSEDFEGTAVPRKKKKTKHEKATNDESSEDCQNQKVPQGPAQNKHEKPMHNGIDEVNGYKVKKKEKRRAKIEEENAIGNGVVNIKKKKKKSKADEEPENCDLKHGEVPQSNPMNEMKKKKKKKKVKCEDETAEETVMTTKKKKKGKHNKIVDQNSTNEDESTWNGITEVSEPKKRKKYEGEINDKEEKDKVIIEDEISGKSTKKKRKKKKEPTKVNVNEQVEVKSDDRKLGQWQTAKLSDTTQQEKFVRLLGGLKSKDGSKNKSEPHANGQSILSRLTGVYKTPNMVLWGKRKSNDKGFASMALDASQSRDLETKLEGQFNDSLQFNLQKRKEGNKCKGFGFQEDPAFGKKHHIDIHKTNSVLL